MNKIQEIIIQNTETLTNTDVWIKQTLMKVYQAMIINT